MRIFGQSSPTTEPVIEFVLEHGEDPSVASHRHGYAVVRPLSADLDGDEITLRLLVRPVDDHEAAPVQQHRGRDADLVLAPGETPRQRQRVAAYAMVQSPSGLLATEYSDRTAVSGLWGLPGGGVDPGETPVEAVLRELDEETGQVVALGTLQTVQTSHWVGRSPRGVAEDFHAVRLVYDGLCENPTVPVVADVDGTTLSARWVDLDSWQSLHWTVGWQKILTDLLG